MRINESLKQAAVFNPTKKSHQMSIWEMCQKIEEQAISLPLYQRDLSWTLQKYISLLNYQLLGKAPVSPISFNVILKTSSCVPQVSFINREILTDVERGQYSVVDGQQRLTTNYKAYMNDPTFKNVVLDLGRGVFTEIKGNVRTNQIPVGILLNKDDFILFNYINKVSTLREQKVQNLLLQIRSKIKNYNYTINSAEDLSEDEQIEWFEVLNNAGSRVSIIQMRFSKLKAHGIDIYTQYTKEFQNKLLEIGYDKFFIPQKTVVSYPIAALNSAYEKVTERPHSGNFAPIPSDTKENQLCNLKPVQLLECFNLTLGALDTTLDFIKNHKLKTPDRIDYINYLVGYFVLNGTEIDKETERYLVDWFNNVDFVNKSNSTRREIFNELIKNKVVHSGVVV